MKKPVPVPFRLKLKGKTAVFIDWANVYGWQETLKKKITGLSRRCQKNWLQGDDETSEIYPCKRDK